jgi:HD-GYP domain-containing protein (c-di-GMP phosphodiesterase class II)
LAVAIAREMGFRDAFPLSEALEKMSFHSGSKYDHNVVAACLRLFNEKGYKLEET